MNKEIELGIGDYTVDINEENPGELMN